MERKSRLDKRSLTPTSLSHNSSQPRTTEQRVLLLWRWHSGRKLPKPSIQQPRVRMPPKMTLWPLDTSSSSTRSRPSTSIGVRPSGNASLGQGWWNSQGFRPRPSPRGATSDLSTPNFWRMRNTWRKEVHLKWAREFLWPPRERVGRRGDSKRWQLMGFIWEWVMLVNLPGN